MSEEVERELGIITEAVLGFEDHGVLTFSLHFDFGNSGQSFCGFDIRGPKGGECIARILNAVGVSTWSKLVGREMWVIRENKNGRIVAIEAPTYRRNTKPFNIVQFFEESKKHHE